MPRLLRFTLLGIPPIALFLLLCTGCSSSVPVVPEASKTTGLSREAPKAIRLVVDRGNDIKVVYDALPWSPGDTVLSAMMRAKTSTPPLAFEFTGSGETAFVTEIAGVKNQGSGESTRNWLCWVNGHFLDRSAGVYAINAGDEVLWKFSTWPPP